MPRAARLVLIACAILGFGAAVRAQEPRVQAPGAQEFRQVYLVQSSGWMEPFFTDSASQFRPLVESLVAATRLDGVEVAVASFDQNGQVVGQTSPRLLYAGPFRVDAVGRAVKAVDLQRKTAPGQGGGYTDADFAGALVGAIANGLKGEPGIVWMITNNKNSPSNSQDVDANTQAFYAKLRDSDAISRIVAFPVRMPVKGRTYQEGGFVIYGIGYGPAGAKALDVLLAPTAPLASLFTDPPVLIKPVVHEPVELSLERLETSAGSRLEVENGILKLSNISAEAGDRLRFKGRLHSRFYPQRVAHASVELVMQPVAGADGSAAGLEAAPVATVEPATVENIPPRGDSGEVTVDIALPPVSRPPGIGGWFARDRVVDGVLTVRLTNLVLDLDPGFLARVQPIFGSGVFTAGQSRTIESQLPDVFLDFKRITETSATVPVRFVAEFSPWPAILLGGGSFAALAALAAAGTLLLRSRTHRVALGPYPRQVRLKPFRPEIMTAPDGSRWRVSAGPFGAASATRLDAGGATPPVSAAGRPTRI